MHRSLIHTLPWLARFNTPLVRRGLQLAQPVRHLVPFAVVGVSGLLVNSTILAIATNLLGMRYLLVAAALATLGSTLWNFTLTEVVVFRDRRRPGWPKRLVMFFIMNNVALLLRGPIMYEFTFGLGLHYLISNLLSIGAVTLVRYIFSDKFIWRASKPPRQEDRLG